MRRPINWFVFCLSLAFLFANLSFGNKPAAFVSQATPSSAQIGFSHVTVGDADPPQFGYVRADGTFLPLAQQPVLQPDPDAVIEELDWLAPAAPKNSARF
jgi:hypothetical protein